MFFSHINLDVHISTKINTFRTYKGVSVAIPPEAEESFKKSNKMEAFPLLFCILSGLLDPKNYELTTQLP